VMEGLIELQKIPTESNIADCWKNIYHQGHAFAW